ncbi:MAG: hypothetical protein LRY56_02820 [Burkholderiaceae bacterium]|nr:hypothetical protein [Burkholderiaceae bacterium]MCD8536486.1 hypothetical protein [Burkholderiaceae bacterium]
MKLDEAHRFLRDQMGNTLTHHCLWINHVVSTNTFSDLAIGIICGLNPNIYDSKLYHGHYGQEAS